MAHLDADRLQPLWLADAGELQQLRRVNRAGADDHFAGGARFALLAMHVVAHADAALAVEQQAFGQRVGDDGQVRPGASGIEVTDRGAHTATPADGRLGHADAVLLGAVVVLGVGDADLAGGLDQRIIDRAALVALGHLQRSVAAAIVLVGIALEALHVAEDRQHLAIAPATIAELRPGVVVLRLATHEHHAVDR